jgi:hypothetical protein
MNRKRRQNVSLDERKHIYQENVMKQFLEHQNSKSKSGKSDHLGSHKLSKNEIESP